MPASARAILVLVVAFAVGGMGSKPGPTIATKLETYQKTLLAYFREFNLLPIFLPAGQEVGDVFESDT